ncbi:MAG: uroporphyrinogen-III synthase [Tateyamaria sp.]
MTRPIDQARQFVEAMPDDLRAQVAPVFSPLIDIVPNTSPASMADDEAALFTSANGVRHAPPGAGRAAFCVGRATTTLAASHGWAAHQMGEDADGLVRSLLADPPAAALVHLRGQHTRGAITDRLAHAGLQVRSHVVYDQVLKHLSEAARKALLREQIALVPLFSPRTATQFAKEAPRATSMRVIALSAAVAEACEPLDVAAVADRPDATAMYEALGAALGAG